MEYKKFLEILKNKNIKLKDFSEMVGISLSTIYNSWKINGIPKWVSLIINNDNILNNNEKMVFNIDNFDQFGKKDEFIINYEDYRNSIIINDDKKVIMNELLINMIRNDKPFISFFDGEFNDELYIEVKTNNIEVFEFNNKVLNSLKDLNIDKMKLHNKKIIIKLNKNSNEENKEIIEKMKLLIVDLLGSFTNGNKNVQKDKKIINKKFYIFFDGFINNKMNNDNMEIFFSQCRSLKISVTSNLEIKYEKDVDDFKRIISNSLNKFMFMDKYSVKSYSELAKRDMKVLNYNQFIYEDTFLEIKKGCKIREEEFYNHKDD